MSSARRAGTRISSFVCNFAFAVPFSPFRLPPFTSHQRHYVPKARAARVQLQLHTVDRAKRTRPARFASRPTYLRDYYCAHLIFKCSAENKSIRRCTDSRSNGIQPARTVPFAGNWTRDAAQRCVSGSLPDFIAR